MSTLPPPSGGDFERVPPGIYPAICYRVIDLGRQKIDYKGETKVQHKIMLSWEIADNETRMSDGRAFTISSRYTWSMHEKSSLRRDLESWRGVPFTEADFGENGFNIKKLIGAPCMLNLVQETKDGKNYTNIASISRLPKQMQAAPLTNATAYLWLTKELFDPLTFSELSDNIKSAIMASPEYIDATRAEQKPHHEAAPKADFIDDDIPF